MNQTAELLIELADAGYKVAFWKHEVLTGGVVVEISKGDHHGRNLVSRHHINAFRGDALLLTLIDLKRRMEQDAMKP